MIKTIKEDGQYYIKRVQRLPKRGNANVLYILKSLKIDTLYRWNVFTSEYESIKVINESPELTTLSISSLPQYDSEAEATTAGLITGTVYMTTTGDLKIKL